MAQGVTPSGIAVPNRVENTSNRKLHAKVVDQILGSQVYASRLLGRGKKFEGSTYDVTFDILDANSGEFFTGLETLSGEAEDTTVTGSYAHTAFAQPVVSVMLESMANVDSDGNSIKLDTYKDEKAIAQAVTKFGSAVYGLGVGGQPLGLRAIVDDGTNKATIAGLSRTTYTSLKAGYAAASGGALTIASMATADDTASAAGMAGESPNIIVTTKAGWNFYEQLVDPKVRIEYSNVGGDVLPLRGTSIVKRPEIRGGAGFTALSFRGIPVIADDACPTGCMFFLNENYLFWAGRNVVPSEYRGKIEKVSLGTPTAYEGTGAMLTPPTDYGWFVQPKEMMPYQAGLLGRYYIIGQVIATSFRRHYQINAITTIA
jgi:hypothetical protein